MFNKTISIKKMRIDFQLTAKLYYHDDACYVFGFPLLSNAHNLNRKTIHQKIHSIGGYYLIIFIDKQSILLANDITGGFRCYYFRNGDEIFITDNYFAALDKAAQSSKLKINQTEIDFWSNHDYTTGEDTFFTQIKKVAPGSFLHITEDDIKKTFYFKDVSIAIDSNKYIESVYQDLKNTVAVIKKQNRQVILLFSGGLDSTLLALQLKEQSVPFVPISFVTKPMFEIGSVDYVRCKQISKVLNLKTQYIEVNLGDEDIVQQFSDITTESMLLNRHVSIPHFYSAQKIRDNYGSDVIIVCGQGADSIFSYGPTDKTLRDGLVRSLYHVNSTLFGIFVNLAISFLRLLGIPKGKRYRYFVKPDELFLLAFFDGAGYIPIYDTLKSKYRHKYVLDKIIRLTNGFHNKETKTMFLKNYGFLQGPANQVVFNSFRTYGINDVVLPYCTSGIIYSTVSNRNGFRDILCPKYVVSEIMSKKFAFKYPKIDIKGAKSTQPLIDVSKMMQDSNRRFDKKLEEVLEVYAGITRK